MRQNFPAAVKRAALERSGGRCEAVGERYGLPPGVRCQNAISEGEVEFDHYPRGAHDPHPDTKTLANCVACCAGPIGCNQFANHKVDTPREAKMKRVTHREAVHAARMAKKTGLDIEEPAPKRKAKPRKIQTRGWPKAHRPLVGGNSFRRTK